MAATATNTDSNPVTPENTADMVTGKAADLASSAITSIPLIGPLLSLFGFDKKVTSSNTFKKLQNDARDAIVTQGNDKSSFLGQIFGWIGEMIQSIGAWFDKTFGGSDAAPSTPPKANTNNTPPAGDPKAAQAAANNVKPQTPVQGGTHADTATAQNTPGTGKGQTNGAQK